MKWFSRSWWEYLLTGCSGPRNFWCRVRGHPNGPIFYISSGQEPDWRCKDCGEKIG
jgi:hypothetical protein